MNKVTDILISLFIVGTSFLVGMLNIMDGGAGIITIGCVACVIGGSFILAELCSRKVK